MDPRFVRRYRIRLAAAMVALVIAAGAVLALGQGLRHVIDTGLHAATAALLDRLLGGMLAVVVTMAAATYARFYLVSWIGERVIADIRHAVFDHLLALSPGYFETQRTGDVISRLTSDVAQLDGVLSSSVSLALRNSLLLTGGLIMLFLTSPRLTALALVGIPFIVMPTLLLARRVRRLARASQDAIAEVNPAGEGGKRIDIPARMRHPRHPPTRHAVDSRRRGQSANLEPE